MKPRQFIQAHIQKKLPDYYVYQGEFVPLLLADQSTTEFADQKKALEKLKPQRDALNDYIRFLDGFGIEKIPGLNHINQACAGFLDSADKYPTKFPVLQRMKNKNYLAAMSVFDALTKRNFSDAKIVNFSIVARIKNTLEEYLDSQTSDAKLKQLEAAVGRIAELQVVTTAFSPLAPAVEFTCDEAETLNTLMEEYLTVAAGQEKSLKSKLAAQVAVYNAVEKAAIEKVPSTQQASTAVDDTSNIIILSSEAKADKNPCEEKSQPTPLESSNDFILSPAACKSKSYTFRELIALLVENASRKPEILEGILIRHAKITPENEALINAAKGLISTIAKKMGAIFRELNEYELEDRATLFNSLPYLKITHTDTALTLADVVAIKKYLEQLNEWIDNFYRLHFVSNAFKKNASLNTPVMSLQEHKQEPATTDVAEVTPPTEVKAVQQENSAILFETDEVEVPTAEALRAILGEGDDEQDQPGVETDYASSAIEPETNPVSPAAEPATDHASSTAEPATSQEPDNAVPVLQQPNTDSPLSKLYINVNAGGQPPSPNQTDETTRLLQSINRTPPNKKTFGDYIAAFCKGLGKLCSKIWELITCCFPSRTQNATLPAANIAQTAAESNAATTPSSQVKGSHAGPLLRVSGTSESSKNSGEEKVPGKPKKPVADIRALALGLYGNTPVPVGGIFPSSTASHQAKRSPR